VISANSSQENLLMGDKAAKKAISPKRSSRRKTTIGSFREDSASVADIKKFLAEELRSQLAGDQLKSQLVEVVRQGLPGMLEETVKSQLPPLPPVDDSSAEPWQRAIIGMAQACYMMATATAAMTRDVRYTLKLLQSELCKVADFGYKICVLQQGWVLVGQLSQEGSQMSIRNAHVLRRWGTEQGLGEMAEFGPIRGTALEPAGLVQCHELSLVCTFDCNQEIWSRVRIPLTGTQDDE